MSFEHIDEIMEKYGRRHDALIGMMQEIQRRENHLPEDALRYLAEELEVPLSRVHYIATFYKSFSLTPRGRHIIKVCLGTACHLNGAAQSLEQMARVLDIKEGETTKDMLFSLETVNCVGTCALAPVTVVDDKYYDEVTPGKVEKILKRYTGKQEDSKGEKS